MNETTARIKINKLPEPGGGRGGGEGPTPVGGYEYMGDDTLSSRREQTIGLEGMKIDRVMLFDRFADKVREDETIAKAVFSSRDLRAVPEEYRDIIPEYVKDYVSLNQFM